MEKSLQQEAWETLSAINVNDKTETKGAGQYALTYLSWAWAWGVLMQYYPESEYRLHEDKILPNGSVIVGVTLVLRKGEQSFERYMWLPVMDHKNAPVINPNSTQLNKTYMRCLAKAIAMCGLGHYIYAGEDMPSEDEPKAVANPTPSMKLLESFSQRAEAINNIEDLNELWAKAQPHFEKHEPHNLEVAGNIYDERLNQLANL
ncbi:DUF1071 domain-containing protein [Pasteurellaceae bacterium 20609_3]|uniref:Sak single strand annealing protein n=1 Tax=Spirabiliibacterium mucosae TaxID=28156 RepID=UPI001AACC471|nr:DUF1071 domain-containing protein [Spirabiliibacterium mucosae]MBE2898118.1 DUF1071 domain-containing protein [Spirabiliibacterium mucosae]